MKGLVVAIDGPAGAGKSTIAKLAAERLGYAYIDTGAMYRAVTLAFLESGRPFDPAFISRLAQEAELCFKPEAGVNRVYLEGREVTEAIRSREVTGAVSAVAALAQVREALVEQQRRLLQQGSVIMDGRDIGTVVYPQAQVKVFLTASVAERARRRYLERQAKGEEVDLEELQKEIIRRDEADASRAVGPLKQAPDALYLDTSHMSIEEVAAYIVGLVQSAEKEADR